MENPKNKFGFRFCVDIERYGVDYSDIDIIRVLDYFGVDNSDGYLFPSSGVFYTFPREYHLRWESRPDSGVLSPLPEIDIYNLSKNLRFEMKRVDMKRVDVLPGETRCDETCIFFGSCDGERGSFFNPSTRLFPCDEYNLNKDSIKVW